MPKTDIWAVIPVKDTSKAKGRLANLVPKHLRPGLSLAMFEDVLDEISKTKDLSGIVVVTIDSAASSIAKQYGARIFSDEPQGGHTAVIAAAARRLQNEGCEGMLQIPGDIPLITKNEVSLILSNYQPAPSFAIVPSHDDRGSNAILVSPPCAVPLTFGENSFVPHLSAAKKNNINPQVIRIPRIARDIDCAEDVRIFTSYQSATRTQTFLECNGLGNGNPKGTKIKY